MSEKTIPMWKVKFQCKWQKFKNWTKDKATIVYNKAKEHPEATVAILGVAASAGKFVYKEHKKNEDIRRKECMFYDRRSDEWHESKRVLKPKEARELERFYKDGGLKSDYLAKKGLLKY